MNPTISLGIPTYLVGASLIKTLQSVREADGGKNLAILVICDTNPVSDEMKKKLRSLRVKLIENSNKGTQYSKFQELLSTAKTQYLIVTHDDVLFESNTIAEIKKTLRRFPNATIISSHIAPLKPSSILESILATGQNIAYQIGSHWNKADNYLLANARCMTYKRTKILEYKIPQTIVNGDAYLYFANKVKQNSFVHSANSVAYIKCPSSIKEHMNQHSRFQQSQQEMKQYFTDSFLKKEYSIPTGAVLKSIGRVLTQAPLQTIGYMALSFVLKFAKADRKMIKNPNWEIDYSTKNN